MLSKKIACLLLSASFLTPAAAAAIENFDPECVEAATNFIDPSYVSTDPWDGPCLYAMPPARGDVNDDNKVDISDYTLLRKYIESDNKKSIKIDEFDADLNRDGKIDYADLSLLRNKI